MKKTIALLSALLLPAAALAGELFESYGLDRSQGEESVLGFMLNAPLWVPPASKALRAVPAKERAAVVKLFGKAARAYAESPGFGESYTERRTAMLPLQPEPPRDGKTLVAAQKAELDEGLASTEETLELMSEEQRVQVRAAMAQMRAAQAAMAGEASSLEAADKERYLLELADYRRAVEELPPEKPREGLAAGLRRFLQVSAEVDFNAKLVESDGIKRFANPDYEARPDEWKICFRAGKEATAAARAFAQEWLASLK